MDSIRLHAMADDLASAICTSRRERLNGTLETVEGVRRPIHSHLETVFILIPAHLAFPGVTIPFE
jgi:hypothetical protein